MWNAINIMEEKQSIKKKLRGHNSPEKNTSILCLTDSILSSQRVRALSPETTVTETRAFEAAISEISSNVDLTTPYWDMSTAEHFI